MDLNNLTGGKRSSSNIFFHYVSLKILRRKKNEK